MKRRGFTLVELLIVIGIVALLISILMPALSRARGLAYSVSCMSNLRQLGAGLNIYAGDNRGSLPFGYWNGNIVGTGTSAGATAATDWTLLVQNAIDHNAAGNYGDWNTHSTATSASGTSRESRPTP